METKFIAVRDQVVADRFGEETFLVNFRNGRYYAMRGAAGLVWQQLEWPQSASSLLDRFARIWGSSLPKSAHADIPSFLDQLKTEGLVVESAQSPLGDPPSSDVGDGSPYQSPVLEIFDDLSELITVDPVHEVDSERGWPVQPK